MSPCLSNTQPLLKYPKVINLLTAVFKASSSPLQLLRTFMICLMCYGILEQHAWLPFFLFIYSTSWPAKWTWNARWCLVLLCYSHISGSFYFQMMAETSKTWNLWWHLLGVVGEGGKIYSCIYFAYLCQLALFGSSSSKSIHSLVLGWIKKMSLFVLLLCSYQFECMLVLKVKVALLYYVHTWRYGVNVHIFLDLLAY